MKVRVAVVAIACSFIAHHAAAALYGSDDFSNPSASALNWTASSSTGGGLLTVANGRLEFSSSSSTPSRQTFEWARNQADTLSNWTAQVDVNLPAIAMTSGQRIELDLGLSAGNGDYMAVTLARFYGAATSHQAFGSDYSIGTNADAVAIDTTSTSGALRMRFDATTHTLYADYDADGAAGGYAWTNLLSHSWTSSPGYLALLGSASNLALTSASNVYFDNVQAVPEPSTWATLLAGLGVMVVAARTRLRTLAGMI